MIAIARAALIAGIMILACSGCGNHDNPELATPQSTAAYYISNAYFLEHSVDGMAYGKLINCFSPQARSYFENNYLQIAGEEYVYEIKALSGMLKQAYAFQVAVLPAGPSPGNGRPEVSIVSSADREALVLINGKQVRMIKQANQWQIDELFGLMH
ncbi:MAG: hypothetical protein P9M14_10790 [Candidatus Alcyoniella australis]|nr:hypothetical protein [Candidatus Alcyoniella australis]